MSVDLHVFLKDSLVPSADLWRRAIHKAGFELTLYENLLVREHHGFLPAVYKGHTAGFEFDLSDGPAFVVGYPLVASQIAGYDLVANFRWSENITEGIAAIIASAVLTNLCDGLLFDPQDNAFITQAYVLEYAKQRVEELERRL